jgi:predicted metal-dependent hydrolase
MTEQHYDDVTAHIVGCLSTLERKRRERALHELIQELKAAERDGRRDDVRRLNEQINEMRMQKAGVPLATLAPAVKE